MTDLRDERLAEALEILKDADIVELKLTVPDRDQSSAIAALGIDVLDAEIRQVVYFDTPDLRLHKAGVVARARRIRGGGDSEIQLRQVVPEGVPWRYRRLRRFEVVAEGQSDGLSCSGSLTGKADNADVTAVVAGKKPIKKLFSRIQRSFYGKHAPDGLDLDRLVPLGPINTAKVDFTPEGYDGRMVGELSFLPDGSRVLDLSTACAPREAFQVMAETKLYLSARGLDLAGHGQARSPTVLEYFAISAANEQWRREVAEVVRSIFARPPWRPPPTPRARPSPRRLDGASPRLRACPSPRRSPRPRAPPGRDHGDRLRWHRPPRAARASSDFSARSRSNAPRIKAPAPQPTRTPTGPPRTRMSIPISSPRLKPWLHGQWRKGKEDLAVFSDWRRYAAHGRKAVGRRAWDAALPSPLGKRPAATLV